MSYQVEKPDLGLIQSFQTESIGLRNFEPSNMFEKLVLAQHYGLYTRLLDWSDNPLVALWFAINQSVQTSEDACVWKLGVSSQSFNHACYKSLNEIEEYCQSRPEKFFLAHPPHIDSRVTRQGSIFTLHALKLNCSKESIDKFIYEGEGAPYRLKQFIIEKKNKKRILNDLYMVGVHSYSIFGDLEGLAEKINHTLRDS